MIFYKNPKSNRENPFRRVYDNPEFKLAYKNRKNPVKFPLLIDLELTNHCNLSCLFCGQQGMTRQKGFMDEKIFRKIINECARHNTAIRFIRWGEPFLHPQAVEFIKMAKKKNLLVHVTTNGLLLSEEMLNGIMDSGLDSMIFSFQGATKREYEKMRNNNKYENLKNNILNLVDLRGQEIKPYIHISSTVTNESNKQIDQFIKYWGKIADSVGMGKTNLSLLTPNQVKSMVALGKIDILKKQETIKKVYLPCLEIFQKLSVNFDGQVTACCSDFDNYLIVGDIKNESLERIWKQSPELKAYRSLLDAGRFRSLTLCSTCFRAYENF